jgi:hypothetical protein
MQIFGKVYRNILSTKEMWASWELLACLLAEGKGRIVGVITNDQSLQSSIEKPAEIKN